MKHRAFFLLLFIAASCSTGNDNDQPPVKVPALEEPSAESSDLTEITGCWRIDSMAKMEGPKRIVTTEAYQALNFRPDGTFSMIDRTNGKFSEHQYGYLVYEKPHIYAVANRKDTEEDALSHWLIESKTDRKMVLKDYTVFEVSGAFGYLYVTKVEDPTGHKSDRQ